MCQLLGMNCAAPTDCSFSFRGFRRRGGATDIHSHGFGVCIYEGRGLRTFLDTLPAAISPVAELIQRYPVRTYNMMAHVRYATQGSVSLENVHPFSRELWGIHWCFSHNGEVPKFCNWQGEIPRLGKTTPELASYRPIGDTDSEAVFCAILNAVKAEFDSLPTLAVLHSFLRKLCYEIIEGHTDDTIFNFLLGCGQYTMFAYSWPGRRPGSEVWNGLHYIVREPPFSTAKLVDDDYTIDFATVTTPNDRVAVITTKPLTNEKGWTEFQAGELLMFDHGIPHSTAETCDKVERQGRGLYSRCFGKACPKQQRAAMSTKLSNSAQTTMSTPPAIIYHSDASSETSSTLALSECSSEPSSEEDNPPAIIECPLASVEAAVMVLQVAEAATLVATTKTCPEAHTLQQQPSPAVSSSTIHAGPRRVNRIIEC